MRAEKRLDPDAAQAGEPLAPEDVAILRLETPAVAGHTLKIAILDPDGPGPPPDAEALRARIAERIERVPQLRRKLYMPPGRRPAPAWVEDPDLDLREHVQALSAPEPASDHELKRVIARLMEERLDRARPLWTMDVLEHLDDGGVAIIWKIHHSMADGATAMRFAEELLWDPSAQSGHGAPGSGAHRPLTHLAELREAASARRPVRLRGTLRRELHRTRFPSPFDGVISGSRVVDFATVPLGALKRAAKALVPHATVNDVVLALVTGGLRCWAEAHGGPLATVRVKVPVSLHNRAPGPDTANRDSLFFLALPLEEPDPVERLRRINVETTLRKQAGDPLVLDTLLHDLGRVAPPLRRLVERLTLDPRAFALGVSNVVGSAEPRSVLGAPVRALHSIAEIRERHGLRVAVVSFADELHFGLCGDPAIVRELEPLVTGILREASALADRARAAA